MANYQNLLAVIAANIYTNGNQEVTAAMVKAAAESMVGALGFGYQCAGVATPDTDPGTPDPRLFYIASENGTYTHFGGVQLQDQIAIFLYDEDGWRAEFLSVSLNIEDLAYVAEDGFFIVDEALNIGFCVDASGAHAKNIIEYEILN